MGIEWAAARTLQGALGIDPMPALGHGTGDSLFFCLEYGVANSETHAVDRPDFA